MIYKFNMVLFHGYVKLPEGNSPKDGSFNGKYHGKYPISLQFPYRWRFYSLEIM